MKQHAGIQINRQFIKARRIVNADKRIIISDTPPSIIHDSIAQLITSFNVKITSNITFIKFGTSDKNLSHVQSFRRQMYVDSETLEKLHTSAVLVHNNQRRWIFFNDDKVQCFRCKEFGHISAAYIQVNDNDENNFDSEHSASRHTTQHTNLPPQQNIQTAVIHAPHHTSPKINIITTETEDSRIKEIQTVVRDILHNSS